MSRLTVRQALEKVGETDPSDNDEKPESSRGISSRPKKRRGPKKNPSSASGRKLRVRGRKVEKSASPSKEEENSADENEISAEASAEKLQPVKSDSSAEESSDEEEPSTPEHLQQRRWMRSPMEGIVSDNEESDGDANDIPMHDVRRSLKFDNLSPERTHLDELANDEPSSRSQPGPSTQRRETTSAEDDAGDELQLREPAQFGYMKPSEVQELLKALDDPWVQQKAVLFEQQQKKFAEWHLSLRMGLNLLLYGVGSKRSLLETFRERTLSLEVAFVIEGFRQDCNLKTNFAALHEQLINGAVPKNAVEIIDSLGKFISENYDHFNLLIHSIDGPALRNSASQRLLARFAGIKNVHVVATMDHPNLPQLWSQQEASDFRWAYQHAPTFVDYEEYPLPDLTRSGPQNKTLILASLQHVFDSLTANAKLIYQEIAKFQTKDTDSTDKPAPIDSGMPYKDLYRVCRSSFLVSTEPVLRKQLTEFYDHSLLRNQRGTDGIEYLHIPIADAALKEFLTSLSA